MSTIQAVDINLKIRGTPENRYMQPLLTATEGKQVICYSLPFEAAMKYIRNTIESHIKSDAYITRDC